MVGSRTTGILVDSMTAASDESVVSSWVSVSSKVLAGEVVSMIDWEQPNRSERNGSDGPTQNEAITSSAPTIKPIIAIIKTTMVTVCFLAGIGLEVGVSGAGVVSVGLRDSAGGVGVAVCGGFTGGGMIGFGEAGGGVGLVAMSLMGDGELTGGSSLAVAGGGTIKGLIAGAGGIPT